MSERDGRSFARAVAAFRHVPLPRSLEQQLERMAFLARASGPPGEPAIRGGRRGRRWPLAMCAGVLYLGVTFTSWKWDYVLHGDWHVERVSVGMPSSGTAWVSLPVSLAAHGDEAEVQLTLDAPSFVPMFSGHGSVQSPARQCAGPRCLHTWRVAGAQRNVPHVLVAIDAPGRYEFRVLHRSTKHSGDERFVVLAKP